VTAQKRGNRGPMDREPLREQRHRLVLSVGLDEFRRLILAQAVLPLPATRSLPVCRRDEAGTVTSQSRASSKRFE
jgi:hypothetical protein